MKNFFALTSPLTLVFMGYLFYGLYLLDPTHEGWGFFLGIIIASFSLIPLSLHLLILTFQKTLWQKFFIELALSLPLALILLYFF